MSARRLMRSGVIALLMVLPACAPQPTSCDGVVDFDTFHWCGGAVPIPGTTATAYTQIFGTAATSLDGAEFVSGLGVGVQGAINSHGTFLWSFGLAERSSSPLAVIGVGTYEMGTTPGHSIAISLVDQFNPFVVTAGAITITEFDRVEPGEEGPAHDVGEVTRLRSTFWVDTDHGHLTGAISIG